MTTRAFTIGIAGEDASGPGTMAGSRERPGRAARIHRGMGQA
jgi:hypothetical protein